VYEKLTGQTFERPDTTDIEKRIETNMRHALEEK
jgi:hypothetical protein